MGLLESNQLEPFNRAPINFVSPTRQPGAVHSLPELVDYNAIHNASRAFCIQAKPGGDLETITHADFKIAAANCSKWFQSELPSIKAATKAPVALFMESDFGLVLHQFALLSLGVPALVLSVRLPPNAIMHLLKSTGAASFVVSERLSVLAKPALAALGAAGITTAVGQNYAAYLERGIDATSKGKFEAPKGLDDVILLLHSSGTTGLPKPIQISHRMLMFSVSMAKFDTEDEAQGLNMSTLPLFHGFGLVAPGLSMTVGKTTLYPASDGIPTIQSILDLIEKTKARSLMTVPFLLDDVINNENGLKTLARLDFVGTGGAALGPGVGDKLEAAGIRLLNFYGTTEAGPLSSVFVPKDNYNWRFFRLRTDMNFTVGKLEPKDGTERYRLTIHPFGEAEGQVIADQLIRNDEYPETDFAAVGRDDDVIVLATGEKASPQILESMLNEAPMVKAAIAFGENQFYLGVIIEPKVPLTDGGEIAFKELVWPIIVAAGQKMDAHSRIPSLDAVIIVPHGKSVPRTDKGSIARKEAYVLFDGSIKKVYNKLGQTADSGNYKSISLESLEDDILALVTQHSGLGVPDEGISVDKSLFDYGLDSLRALNFRRILLAAVSKSQAFEGVDVNQIIPAEFMYINPSVSLMADALKNRSVRTAVPIDRNAHKAVDELIEQYALSGNAWEEKRPCKTEEAVVVVTGSSGSFGSHIVAKLAASEKVRRVVLLLRKGSKSFSRDPWIARGINLSENEWAKVTSLEVDPIAENLGLDLMTYEMLQKNATHVIHAAWPMNYLMSVQSFKPQLDYLSNLLKLASSGSTNTKRRFIFISSIAAVARLALSHTDAYIPEAPVISAEAACGIGYADGKLVCEKLLEEAAVSHSGCLEVAYIRCGQIAGSRSTGAWNTNEQIPILFRTAKNLGVLPEIQGTFSWIPVDDAASTVMEISFTQRKLPLVFHLENPKRQLWADLINGAAMFLGIQKPLVPWFEWLDMIATAEDGVEDNLPVKKLFAFFKFSFLTVAGGQVILGTDVARSYSETLAGMDAVDAQVIAQYFVYWQKIGYM